MANLADEFVVVGRIAGVYGVRGWVRVESFTEPLTNIFNYHPWYLGPSGHPGRECGKATGRPHGKGLVAKLEEVSDRNTAATLVNFEVSVKRALLPENTDGSYYWTDLVGMDVVTVQGLNLGQVDHLIETGANDVLVVEGDRQRLIPFVMDQFVVAVDLATNCITVDWDPEF